MPRRIVPGSTQDLAWKEGQKLGTKLFVLKGIIASLDSLRRIDNGDTFDVSEEATIRELVQRKIDLLQPKKEDPHG